MKNSHVIAAAAAAMLAISAGAASAQNINQGQSWQPASQPNQGVGGGLVTYDKNHSGAAANRTNAQSIAGYPVAWHAYGTAGADNGTAEAADGATFTLTGTVSTDCAYYSGDNTTETLDFGTIGIYATDINGPVNAFRMGTPANVTIDTNLAGCNTANTVRIAKTDVRGLVSDNTSGWDSDVFQNNLPYSVTARYKASTPGAPNPGVAQSLILPSTLDQVSRPHGAWKSAMALDVVIPRASKALVAGTYTGTFGVTISAGL